MPAADLKADLKANLAELVFHADDGEPMTLTAGELAIANHLKHTLWPFLEGIVDQLGEHEAALEEAGEIIEELDEAVDELTENRGSVLLPQEAGVFALLVQVARSIVAKLEHGDKPTADELGGLKVACDAAERTIAACTINVDLDDESQDDDDDEGDDDDDDE